MRGIHPSPVISPHNGQWRGALMFSLISARINGWVNNREAGDLRRHRAHYDVIVMICWTSDVWLVYAQWFSLFVIVALCEIPFHSGACHVKQQERSTSFTRVYIIIRNNNKVRKNTICVFGIVLRYDWYDCLLNRLFRRKKPSKLPVTGFCREFAGDQWIPRTKGQ